MFNINFIFTANTNILITTSSTTITSTQPCTWCKSSCIGPRKQQAHVLLDSSQVVLCCLCNKHCLTWFKSSCGGAFQVWQRAWLDSRQAALHFWTGDNVLDLSEVKFGWIAQGTNTSLTWFKSCCVEFRNHCKRAWLHSTQPALGRPMKT